MGFRRGFKAEADRIGLNIRQQLNLSEIDRFEPEIACEHFEIELIPLSKLDRSAFDDLNKGKGNFSAMLVPCGIETAIVHNDAHHPNRQRSNISHELAHCFLGHTACTLLDDDGTRKHDGNIEAEASHLGGVLLLPKDAALQILKDGSSSTAGTTYGISNQMLRYRTSVSGAQTIYSRMMKKGWRR